MDDKNVKEAVHNQHDKGYKFLLSSKRVFIELLRSFVKHEWVNDIDEANVVKVDKSFVLQDFADKEADLVYRVRLKEREVIFYILMELQSTVDYQMPYRLLLYMVEIWRSILKDVPKKESRRKDFELPVIVQIVLYNGSRKWTAKTSYKEILNSYETFGEYAVDFKYILIDVNRYTKEELFRLENLIASVFLLEQKVEFEEMMARLNKELSNTLKKLNEDEILLFKAWFKKILLARLPEEERENIERIIDENKEVEKMISNLEKTILQEMKEREKKGMKKGIEKGMEKGIGVTVLKLLEKKFGSVPEEYVKKIEGAGKETLLKIVDKIFEIDKIEDLERLLK
ncbi:Rpn family recombination-promoting nuclease/putative transposase [Caldanaerobacter subterraneus]|uniref:Putative YhgA-like transposase n=1 Tax=Caldanaerobacter subterraneus TaxID=911092 RepID=A0A4R2JSL0_9THEO|nr:Rpn family recombination-promoting nuclease/putative transposase [Caldanaerobacter subterraneus]TCO60226.1 putative YhgA-like transposase [Caldanaerobacter subterraneus]